MTCFSGFTRTRDHPRSRGENACSTLLPLAQMGSSPLTRGKQPRVNQRQVPPGIIPAHAGKTRPSYGRSLLSRDHPRSRGENLFTVTANSGLTGSSPLTRGKPRGAGLGHIRPGIIPAHAGKTSRYGAVRRSLGDHPRSRGENDLVAEFLTRRPGSSPLTRGKPSCSRCVVLAGRIIPAHAGKTPP